MVGGVFGLSNPLVAFRNFIKDPTAQLDDFAKDEQVQNKIEYFKKNITKIESVDDLFKDPRLTGFILSAFSLESETNGLGRIKAVLKSDMNNPASLANILADPKFRDMARTLRLDRDGVKAFDNEKLIDTLTQRFIRNEFEIKIGKEDSALREALFFSRSITNAKTVYDVLGDRVLRSVVQGALDIPKELAIQPVGTQARAIESRIDIKKLISISNELGTTQTQIDNARTDAKLLETNLKSSDKALKQVTTLSEQLQIVLNAYDDLANVTDAVSGPYAADIPFQETAVPELVRFEQMLDAGDNGIKNIEFYLGKLKDTITAAQQTGADLTALKTGFSDLVNLVNTAITESQTTSPSGGTDNILGHGSNDTISTVLDGDGTTVTINRFDLSGLQTYLADAVTAFNAVTSSSDSNLNTALGKILLSEDRVSQVKETLTDDREAFNAQISSVEAFAATLNTNQLLQGKESVADSLDRIGTIESLLKQIKTLADTSKNRLPSADRSDLDAQFTSLKTQLRDAIDNTNTIGLDNFLNNIPDQSYEIITGSNITVEGNIDFATAIADVLDTQDITTQAGASALSTQTILLEVQTDKARNSLEKSIQPLNNVLNKYDPRGVIDNTLYTLQDKVQTIVGDAANGAVNLLSASQKDIVLNVSSAFSAITLNAYNSFESDLNDGLSDAISFLQTDLTQVRAEISDLKDTIDRVKRGLSSDANLANLELAKNSAVIDAADAQEQSLEDNPYQVNDFTKKFIERFLILNGGQGGIADQNSQSFLTSLIKPLQVPQGGGGGVSGILNLIT